MQGTPAFIAPEQALGAATVDNRADIYATGCVAYWLLTGQLVFTGDTPMRLLLHHAHTQPNPPSLRTELPIPQALDDLILSCLAKNPADRPQTARELVGRLEAIHLTSVWSEQRARVVGTSPASIRRWGAYASFQTRRAVSTTSCSLRHWSSSPSRLPSIVDAKPHCGLTARCSIGT